MRRLVPVFIAATLAAAVLAGCHSKKTPPTALSPGPVGVMRLGLARPQTLDPAQARTVEQLMVDRQLFSTLTAYNPHTLAAMPSLADWTASPDQKQWDFKLRPGAVFSNGRPVTAADVKYTFERIARKGSGAAVADELSGITGYAAVATDGSSQELAGVTTPADDVVHISLDVPWSVLPEALASPAFGIVPKEAVEAAAPTPPFAEQPVGSGPYKIRSRTQDHLFLDRVGGDGSKTKVQTIDVTFFDRIADSYQSFERGELDWSRVPPEEVEQAGRSFGQDQFTPYLAEQFYGLNINNPKFADPRFRQAVVQSIDRHAIVSGVYQSTARPLDGIIGAGLPGHVDAACGDKCAHNVEAAKALVAQVFQPGGPPVPEIGIDFDDDPTQQKVAEAIKAGLAEAGIPAVLRAKPLAEYETFAAGNDKDLFRLPWIAPYASPDAFLGPLFLASSRFNLVGLHSADVDNAIFAARAEGDTAKRIAAFQPAEKSELDQFVVGPVGQLLVYAVASPRVKGLVTTTAGTFDAAAVTLAVKG